MLNVLSNRRTHARGGDPSSALVNMTSVTVDPIEPQVYTGEPVTPSVSVSYAGTALIEGTDYSVTYSANTEVGTGIVTLIGLGGYTGTKSVQFQIGSSWDFVFRAGKQTSITNRVYSDPGTGTNKKYGGYVREHGGRRYFFYASWGETTSVSGIARVDITDLPSGNPIDFTAYDQLLRPSSVLAASVPSNEPGFQFYISEDGETLFICTTAGRDRPARATSIMKFWYKVPLSRPFDLTSVGEYSSSWIHTVSYSNPFDWYSPSVRFSPDGLSVYFLAQNSIAPLFIAKAVLSVPFDLSSISSTITLTLLNGGGTAPGTDFLISGDGCYLMVVGYAYDPPTQNSSSTVIKKGITLFRMSTPWNVSTIVSADTKLFKGFDVSTHPRGTSEQNDMTPMAIVPTGDYDFTVALWTTYGQSYVNVRFPSPDLAVSATVDPIEIQFYTGEQVCPVPVVKAGALTLVSGTDYTVTYANNVGSADVPVTTASVIIHGIGDFRGTKIATFHIGQFSNFVTVAAVPDQEYAGLVPICPTLTATDHDGNTMVEGEDADYTVTYENNIHPGVATATLTGMYEGSVWTKTVTFNIKCNIATYGIFGSIQDQAYTTRPLTPSPTMMLADGHALVEGTDFDVQVYSNNTGVGTATVTVLGKGFYYGTKSTTFLIRYDADTYMSVDPVGAQLYTLTGGYPTPEPVVHGVGGAVLVKNQHYTVGYQYSAPGLSTVGSVTVVVTGVGSYMGITLSNTAPMNRSLADAYVDPAIPNQPYTGSEMRPDFVLKIQVPTELNADGTAKKTVARTLVRDTDYSVAQWSNNTSAGTATATVIGITTNGFGGQLSIPFVISYQAPGTFFTIGSISEQTMVGPVPMTPVPSVSCSNGLTVTKDVDYVVEYANNAMPGTGTVTVRGIGSYSGLDPVSRDFSVVSSFSVAPIADQTYTDGTPVCPKPVVTGWSGTTLRESYDYVLAYSDNTTIGTASVEISGFLNGTRWSKTVEFKIKANLASTYVKIDDIPDQTAMGSTDVITPELMVKLDDGTILEKGVDYSVSFSNNTGPGSATVTVTGIGDRVFGTRTLSFLVRQSLSVCAVISPVSDVALNWGALAFSGTVLPASGTVRNFERDGKTVYAWRCGSFNSKRVKPVIAVTANGGSLVEGSDYFITGYESTNPVVLRMEAYNGGVAGEVEADPGEVQVIIEGAGRYSGEARSNVAKIRADIGRAFIRLGQFSKVYTGVPLKPSIDVYALIAYNDDTVVSNMVSSPTVVELDEGNYLTTVGDGINGLFEFTSAGVNLGSYDTSGSSGVIWDFNADTMFTRSMVGTSESWTKRQGSFAKVKLKNTEFSVKVTGNDQPGTATVTVYGVNGFAGTVTRTYEILHPFVVEPIADQTYTGSEITPSVVVKRRDPVTGLAASGAPLTLGTDYTVSYSEGRVDVGTHSVTVTGAGSYSYAPAVQVQFKIVEGA